ncbi:MAG: putative TetR family transcriptional regulator [Betaproteobacteria bacterium]|nr:putative TetR family transcriptional regulator [Betaproteobacteria bacterium]
MKVSREQCAENRERILAAASSLFREKGFDGVGIADIMSAAGLTHGGFYRHFASKDDLAAQTCKLAMDGTADKWSRLLQDDQQAPLPALLAHYLSQRHRDDASRGCMFASLGADAARQQSGVRSAFTGGLNALLELLGRTVHGPSRQARRRKAIATMSEMVGAVILARAVDDPALSNEILAATSSDLLAGYATLPGEA